MQNTRTYFIFLALLILVVAESCVNHSIDPSIKVDCTGVSTVSFANDIQPIITTNCAITDCHNGDLGDDLNWTIPVNFQNHASEAKRRVTLSKAHADHMPREGEITLDQIQSIVCWAEQGAPINN